MKVCCRCKKEKPLSDYYRNQHYCKPCCLIKRREWYVANPGKRSEYRRKYIDKERKYETDRSRRLRKEFIAAYGGCCACCSEKTTEFLTVDHVNNDGEFHRRNLDLNHKRGANSRGVIRDLKRRGWPKEGYRILCYNCNFARGYYGKCPHQI